jgi:integrase
MDRDTMNVFRRLFNDVLDNIFRLVFYSRFSKYNVIRNNNTNKILRDLLVILNINRISVHGLRHIHASVFLYEGVSVYYV